MRILFVHCNYPAQFRHLCSHFANNPEHEVVFLCQNKEWTAGEIEGFRLARYQLGVIHKVSFATPTFAATKPQFFMAKLLCEKLFVCGNKDLILIDHRPLRIWEHALSQRGYRGKTSWLLSGSTAPRAQM